MFREMRLKENELSRQDAVKILEKGSNGILALDGDGDYTYAVPINYAYADDKIYFHGATVGHKLDALKRNNKISFCVVEKDEIIPAEFNSLFRSAIAFGRARVLTDDAERQEGLELILQKYSANFMDGGKKYIKSQWDNVMVAEIDIDHLTGKKGT